MNRKTVWIALGLLAISVTAGLAAEGQAYLGIFAETSVSIMPGMAAMLKNLPPGMDVSKLPPEVAAMLKGGAQRKLDVRLWSPGIAAQDATAWVAPPVGLKLGNRLDLQLYRPTAEEGEGGPGIMPPGAPKFEDMTIKIYWGSSPTVRPGQPKIIKIGDLTGDQKAEMEAQAKATMARAGNWFYKPDWTTAHWPHEKQPGVIKDDASLVGDYALTTNYTGNIKIAAPENVDFLAPFELSSPDPTETPDLTKPLELTWKQIPNALGLHAGITGMEGTTTIIIWTSSEVLPEGMTMPSFDYLEMAEVRKYVDQQVMMTGDATSSTVPEAIFANCPMAMLSMVGYGPGASLPEGQPLPRIQTKTTLTMMLGDMMKGMGGMMGGMGGGDR